MNDLAALFKALSDETRLRILAILLLRPEVCVCDVEGALGITQSKSSRHLRYLRNAGLAVDRREGPWVYYALPKDLGPERTLLMETVRRLLPEETLDLLSRQLDTWLECKREGVCSVAVGGAPAHGGAER